MSEYSRFHKGLIDKYKKPIFVRVKFEREHRDGFKYVFGTYRGQKGDELFEVHIDTMLLRDVNYNADKLVKFKDKRAIFYLHNEDIFLDDERSEKKSKYKDL